MDAISQTTLSIAFSWMKMLEFRLNFHRRLFLRVQLTIFQHWFRLWLGAVQTTSHYLNQWWLVYWRIYASLGLSELRTTFSDPYVMISDLNFELGALSSGKYINCNSHKRHLSSWTNKWLLCMCALDRLYNEKSTVIYTQFPVSIDWLFLPGHLPWDMDAIVTMETNP